mgnify:CR=1 FL=1
MAYEYVDIFSGAGLLSEGFRRAGFSPKAAFDLDSDAISSYRRNISNVAKVSDISVIPNDIKAPLLIAGPPCQGFSTLGRRDPKDSRNEMCLNVPLWAEAIGANMVVVENVPMFVKSSYWKKMDNALKEMGYEVDVWTLDAADYGAPQHRKRSFTIASKIGMPSIPQKTNAISSAWVFEPESLKTNDPMHIWPTPVGIALERIKIIPPCGDKRHLMDKAPNLCPESWFKLGNQATDVWGRINPERPSNTLRCCFQNPSKGRYLHPSENRVISLREGARLQGIPDSWLMSGTRTSIARQVGNGVPIPLSFSIATAIRPVFS